MGPDYFDHAVGRCTGREKPDVLAGFIDQVDKRRMVDHVIRARTWRSPKGSRLPHGGLCEFR